MHRYTAEQINWIKENLNNGVFRNQKHFTDVFNAIFGTDVKWQNMNQLLYRHGWSVKTKHNTNQWTEEQDKWLIKNYEKYDRDFVSMAEDFNTNFNSDKSACCITKHCERSLGIHKPQKKKGTINKGCFKSGEQNMWGKNRQELPVGTIRYNSDGRPFIKVKLCEGQNTHKGGGHNYKEPWWKPLQKKIWEDHYGEVPKGFIVCSLNGDPNDTDINHIGLIDKRGTARMAKFGWWGMDNLILTKNAVTWCNLYYAEKDSEGGLNEI